jgi:hypothetical protein
MTDEQQAEIRARLELEQDEHFVRLMAGSLRIGQPRADRLIRIANSLRDARNRLAAYAQLHAAQGRLREALQDIIDEENGANAMRKTAKAALASLDAASETVR